MLEKEAIVYMYCTCMLDMYPSLEVHGIKDGHKVFVITLKILWFKYPFPKYLSLESILVV